MKFSINDLVTFTDEIINRKLNFLYAAYVKIHYNKIWKKSYSQKENITFNLFLLKFAYSCSCSA